MPKSQSRRRIPKQLRSRATVDAILEAATEAFTEFPIDQTSTRQIAERAGVSVGSFYEYFDDRSSLVMALMTRFADRISTDLHGVLDDRAGESLSVMVRRLVKHAIEIFNSNSAFHARLIRFARCSTAETPFDTIEAPFRVRFAALIASCVEDNSMDANRAALVSVHAARRLIDAACADDRLPIDLVQMEVELVALLENYLLRNRS